MYDRLILSCLMLSFSLSFPYYGDGGEKVAFSLIAAILLISQLFKPKRTIFLFWPIIFIGLITWQCGQTTQIYVRMSYVNLLLWFLALSAVSDRLSIGVKKYGKYIFLFALVNSIFLLAQKIGFTSYLITDVYVNATGFLQFPWVMGVFAVLSIPFIWAFSPFGVIAVFPMIFYSYSLACAAVSFFAILYLLAGNKFFLIFALLALVGVVLFLIFSDRNIDEHRFVIWKKAIFYSKDQIFGNGLGTWAHTGFRRDVNGSNMWWRWAHNESYQVMFENGLVGLSIMAAYLSRLFFVKDKRLLCFMFCLVALSMIHPILHSGKLAIFILLSLAMVERCRHDFNQASRSLA